MTKKLETQIDAINQVALLADMICLPGDGLSGDQIREFAKKLQEFNGCYDVALAQMSFDYAI